MWTTVIIIIFIIIITLILHDVGRILQLQDELIKEQYLMRGELNAILDMASLGTSYLPKFSFSEKEFPEASEEDKTTTVEFKSE